MSTEKNLPVLDIDGVLKLLPHRYPFLLIDRVLEIEHGKTVRCLKNVTINEPFFPGHFPHRPVMPGVMILEALAQAAGLVLPTIATRHRCRRLMSAPRPWVKTSIVVMPTTVGFMRMRSQPLASKTSNSRNRLMA